MLARFGILCSWLGTGIAVVTIGAAVFLPITGSGNRDVYIIARVILLVAPSVARASAGLKA